MLAALFRLLMIASFVIMPLGMSSAPAAAAEHAPASASSPCEGHDQSSDAPDGKAHCAACVAIADPARVYPMGVIPPVPDLVDRASPLLLGLAPEVATPPPKDV